MIANAGRGAARPRAALPASVEVVELPLDDSWLRDSRPDLRVGSGRNGDGEPRRVAVHFRFNAWGEKFPPWDRDAAVGGLIAERLGDPVARRRSCSRVGRSCPTAPARSSPPSSACCTRSATRRCRASRSRRRCAEQLGAERIVWLGHGLLEDRDTDGHVDLIAAFIAPGRVLLQTVDPDNPNFAALRGEPAAARSGRDRGDRAAVPAVRRGRGRDGRRQLPEPLHLQRSGDRARRRRRRPTTRRWRSSPARLPGARGRARARGGDRLRRRRAALHHPAGPGARG